MSHYYGTQNQLLLQNLLEFYKTGKNLETMLSIINGESSISLRIVELTGAFRFNDAVLRNLIVKRNKAITEPSAILLSEEESSGRQESPPPVANDSTSPSEEPNVSVSEEAPETESEAETTVKQEETALPASED